MGYRTILVTFFWCRFSPRCHFRWLTTFSVMLSIDWFFKHLAQGSLPAWQHCSAKQNVQFCGSDLCPQKCKNWTEKKEERRKLAPDLKERFSHARQTVRERRRGHLPCPICSELGEKVNHVVSISMPFLGHAYKDKLWEISLANETPSFPSDYKWRHELLCGLGR